MCEGSWLLINLDTIIPKVAVWKVLTPSTKFLLPVMMLFCDPSPYIVTFTIFFVTVTVSLYSPCLT